MKSLAVSKYFEVIHPQYLYLRLTPVKSLRNNNTDKLIGTIATMYRSLSRRITKEQQKYFFRCRAKAKFRCKMILTCHYLEQISIIRGELRAANTSYMLLAGCDKANFKELAEELAPYAVDDLLSMRRYHSLNLLKTKDGYARFITKLPCKI